jgi:hypothetical protein
VQTQDSERRFLRHLLLGLAAAIAIYALLRFLSERNLRGAAFDLRPSGLALVLDCLFLIVMVEIPVALFSLGFDFIDARRGVQVLAKIFLCLPLLGVSWHILLAKFHTVYVADELISVEGNSTWAQDTFPIAKTGRVELRRGALWDELSFIWFDKIDASGGVFRWDHRAQQQLDALLQELRARKIAVLETR